VVFDRRDDLQAAYLRSRVSRPVDPPRHFVPASGDFVEAVRLGFGWGMVPDLQSGATSVPPSASTSTPVSVPASISTSTSASVSTSAAFVDLDPAGAIDVPLYWQQWQLHTRSLERLSEVVAAAARRTLR